ncbi:MAG: CBS domain-containing protein [Nitrososphaerales archaeon]
MSSPVITIDLEEHLSNALIIISERNIRHLPVVKRGKIIGILTDREILSWVMENTGDLRNL